MMSDVTATAPVTLVTTGGTISTAVDRSTGLTRPTLDGSGIAALLGPHAPEQVLELSKVPSWALDAREMQRIAVRLRDETHITAGGLVVTVGTSTLEYLAYMTDLFIDGDAPVVFTGAMHKADDPDPDGPRNLRDAFAVARAEGSRSRGVVVCFHGRIIAARDVWKKERQAADAFIGIGGDLGSVRNGNVAYVREVSGRRTLNGEIEPAVALVKAYPGCDGALLSAAVAGNARGIVVEGLPGAGGVPQPMQVAMRDAAARGVVVAVASRAPHGSVPRPPTGGTGSPFADAGFLSAGNLTAEKAWVLLMATLGHASDTSGARALFDEIASGEASR